MKIKFSTYWDYVLFKERLVALDPLFTRHMFVCDMLKKLLKRPVWTASNECADWYW